MDKNNFVTTCLGIVVSLVVLIVVATLLNGWALSTIWNWFIPSIFGLPYLTLWKAVGVSMVFELFTGTNRTKKNESNKPNKTYTDVLVESLITVTLTPLISVFIARVVYQVAF